jgi:hypothetical protein
VWNLSWNNQQGVKAKAAYTSFGFFNLGCYVRAAMMIVNFCQPNI